MTTLTLKSLSQLFDPLSKMQGEEVYQLCLLIPKNDLTGNLFIQHLCRFLFSSPTPATEIFRHDLLYACFDQAMCDMLPSLIASRSSWDQVTAVKCSGVAGRTVGLPIIRRAFSSRHLEVKVYAYMMATHFRADFASLVHERAESRPELQWARRVFDNWDRLGHDFVSWVENSPFHWHSAYTYLTFGAARLELSSEDVERVASMAQDDKQLRDEVRVFLGQKFGQGT